MYVFGLEENASRFVGQNSPTPLDEQNSLTPQGNNMNFRLTRDRVVLLETAATLCASRRKANDFFAVFSSSEPVINCLMTIQWMAYIHVGWQHASTSRLIIRTLTLGRGRVPGRSYDPFYRQQIPNEGSFLYVTGNLSDKLTLSNANILIF